MLFFKIEVAELVRLWKTQNMVLLTVSSIEVSESHMCEDIVRVDHSLL